jgi:hypothetical protein
VAPLPPEDAALARHACAPRHLGLAWEDWTFARACAFWRLPLPLARCAGRPLDRRLDAFASALARCVAGLAAGGALPLGGGAWADRGTLLVAKDLHRRLRERYASRLTLIRLRDA